MSRSGYSDGVESWALIRWRGAVNSAIKGRKGQAFLMELAKALDAMPEKKLYANSFENNGEFCALGVVGHGRGIDMQHLGDADDGVGRDEAAKAFGIAPALVAEIMYLNDETIDDAEWVEVEVCGPVRPDYPDYGRHSAWVEQAITNAPDRRWAYMRGWVAKSLKNEGQA